MILRQYTGVAIAGRGLLICGPPAIGKSTLALMLIDRGAVLIGDDGVALSIDAGQLTAAPPPATHGLLEIRNIGLVTKPAATAPIALILNLVPDAPRFIDAVPMQEIEGVPIPTLAFTLFGNGADAIRAEHALDKYGLAVAW